MIDMLTNVHQKKLIKKWAPMLNEGKKIESEYTRAALAQVLENTAKDFAKKGLLKEAYDVQTTGDGAVPTTHSKVLGTGAGKQGNGYLHGQTGYDNAGNYGDFMIPNMVMPILRRVFPDLIAHELVGVQAMNGPVGFAMALRAKYNYNGIVGDGGLAEWREIGGWTPPDTRYTGWDKQAAGDFGALTGDLTAGHGPYTPDITAGNKIPDGAGTFNTHVPLTGVPEYDPNDPVKPFGPYAGTGTAISVDGQDVKELPITKDSLWEAYAGKGRYTNNGRYQGFGADVIPQTEFASLADGTYPTVGLDFIKQTVEAKTRKLGAQWSPELAEDIQAMHGIDVEAEFVNIISYEIGGEIDRQILTEMVKAAITGGSVSVWNPAYADGLDQMGRLATLLTKITVEAQQISFRTRRGNANFVVTSPRVTGLLQQMSMNKFVSIQNSGTIPSVPQSGVGSLQKQGYINDGAQLLVRDAYAQGDYVLMGYKGTHPGDSGLIYCPYIPLQLSKAMRPDTFTPTLGARTRYGLMANPWDARLFYHFIKIAGLNAADVYYWNGARQFIA